MCNSRWTYQVIIIVNIDNVVLKSLISLKSEQNNNFYISFVCNNVYLLEFL